MLNPFDKFEEKLNSVLQDFELKKHEDIKYSISLSTLEIKEELKKLINNSD